MHKSLLLLFVWLFACTSLFSQTVPVVKWPDAATSVNDSNSNLLSNSQIPASILLKKKKHNQAGAPAYTSTYIVIGSEVWTPAVNPVSVITGVPEPIITMQDIVVPPGTSLTIQGITVKLTVGKHIDVQHSISEGLGGRLLLDNCLLTADTFVYANPLAGMWGGVRVSGDPNQSQSPVTSTTQGYVELQNGSEISLAQTAIRVGAISTMTIVLPFVGSVTIPVAGQGGGIVVAQNSTFRNNGAGVIFHPYNSSSSNNLSNFQRCTFTSDNAATVIHSKLVHAGLTNTNTIRFRGCIFENHTITTKQTIGIEAVNASIIVDKAPVGITSSASPSRFTGLTNGIYHTTSTGTQSVRILQAAFIRNVTGIRLSGTLGAVVTGNTFEIPQIIAWTRNPIPPFLTRSAKQSVGVHLEKANAYSVYNNTFSYSGTLGGGPYAPFTYSATNLTVGVLAENTVIGSANEFINNNTYRGLGTANLSNFKNRHTEFGLWYACNTNVNNNFDIAVRGSTPPSSDLAASDIRHGIRIQQGLPGTVSAGNTFSKGGVNLYNHNDQTHAFQYYYAPVSLGGVLLNQPGLVGVTGSIDAISSSPVPGVFASPNIVGNTCGIGQLTANTGLPKPYVIDQNWTEVVQAVAIRQNVNYYMIDSEGVQHRDSLYYWLNELNTPSSVMSSAYLLLQDSLVDSAYAVYTDIPTRFGLTGNTAQQFTGAAQDVFMTHLKMAIRGGAPTTTFASYAAAYDTLTDSTFYAGLLADMPELFANSTGWARNKVANTMQLLCPLLYDSLIQGQPDTLLYPESDSLKAYPSDKGVLTVTELSQGPAAGCQYTELLVSNCNASTSPYVDVRGWRIDDYSGFLTNCLSTNANAGNIRLANNDVWANVTTGSVIVLYNAQNNCYNLPDTFTVDTFAGKYFVPVGGAQYSYIDQFYANENNNPCNYCSDSGTTVYDTVTSWSSVSLDNVFDCIQVICPGCTKENPSSPTMYFGAGYAPAEYDEQWQPSPVGNTNVGLTVVPNLDILGRYKYVFKGRSLAHLLDPTLWEVSAVDTSGAIPGTLGNIHEELYDAVVNNTLGLPCCGAVQQQEQNPQGRQAGQPKDIKTQTDVHVGGLKVYPNPTNSVIYFEFPSSPETVVRIIDVSGRVVHQQTWKDVSRAQINVKAYIPGMYTWHITNAAGTYTGKVVVAD